MYDSNSFSMLFTVPNNYHQHQPYDEADVYSSYADTSAVDCTLSLGTPSTRLSDKKNRSGFCANWNNNNSNNILKPKQTHHHQPQVNKINSRSNGGDSMLTERRCASCDTTSTPLWRNGPRGPKSLCNACGIRYKKEERRANAAASTTTASGGAPVEHQYILNNSWAHHQNSPKYPYYNTASGNEYSFMDGTNHADVDTGIPFLSWGLNVADRPSFVHY